MSPIHRFVFQVLHLSKFEMASYFRSFGGILFAILMPTGMFLVAYHFWYPMEYRSFAVPDMAAIMILSSGIFSVGVAITQQRCDGTLRTYLASPLYPAAYITAQVLDRVVVFFLGNSIMVLQAFFIWNVDTGGNIFIFGLCALLALFTMLSFGFLLSSRFKSVEVAGGSASILFLAVMLASGFFVSTDGHPQWVQSVLGLLPFKPSVDLMRESWIGSNFNDLLYPLVVVAGWGVVFVVLASRWFRWSINGR